MFRMMKLMACIVVMYCSAASLLAWTITNMKFIDENNDKDLRSIAKSKELPCGHYWRDWNNWLCSVAYYIATAE